MSLTKSQRLILIVVSILLAGFTIFNPTLLFVSKSILNSKGNSYGIFIPFLSVSMIWARRNTIKNIDIRFDHIGIPFLFLSILIPMGLNISFQLKFICFVAFISGLCLTLLGRKFHKSIAFSIFYLISLIPIPEYIYSDLACLVRTVTFNGSVLLLSRIGISFYANGCIIQLPNLILNVDLSCGGIHYLLSFFVFGIAYAYFRRSSVRQKFIIVALTIPIAIFASILRITIITLLVSHVGLWVVDPKPHMGISLAIFLSVAILVFSLDRSYQTKS